MFTSVGARAAEAAKKLATENGLRLPKPPAVVIPEIDEFSFFAGASLLGGEGVWVVSHPQKFLKTRKIRANYGKIRKTKGQFCHK